jgi:hypothetical protein
MAWISQEGKFWSSESPITNLLNATQFIGSPDKSGRGNRNRIKSATTYQSPQEEHIWRV